MEKIRELLAQIGASEELANATCEELERYTNAVVEEKEKELNDKIAKVKEICIEEVQQEKVNLARKVGVFLESKAEAIERAMTRQRVAEESEASSLLKKTKGLLEGIELEDGKTSSRELRALQKKAERLERALGGLKEERERAVGKANKANEIALKTLKKNQILEGKLKDAGLLTEEKGGATTCECGLPLAEGEKACKKCCPTCKKSKDKCACEGKDKKDKKAVTEGKLDASRKPAQPKSTRRTLIESEVPGTGKKAITGSPEINKIANEMPEI
jgi:hypothetical protein